MYKDDKERSSFSDRNSEDVYSLPVRAGKRTYFFDVKATRDNNDYFLTITESKRKVEQDGSFTFDKHKIFLYKEDFEKFVEGLNSTVNYIRENLLKDVPEHSSPNEEKSEENKDEDKNNFTDVKFEEL